MKTYFLRRFILIIPTLFGITLLVFIITRFVPGGPIERIISQYQQMKNSEGSKAGGLNFGVQSQPLSDEQINELKKYYGFDKPVIISYFIWLGKVLTGDLGTSTRYYDPVLSMITDRMPISIYYGILSLIISYSICIPLGILKAIKHKKTVDNVSSIFIFVGYAIPGWIIGILLLLLFSSKFQVFPLGGFVSDNFSDLNFLGKIIDLLWHTVLPLLSYVLGSFAVMTFLMKNTLMDNLASDYVRTAMAKGLTFKKAIFNHALRNSLIPIATSFGNNISILISGSFLIETVFNINGMGLLGYESIVDRDYPVVMGLLLIEAMLFLVGNILSDICVAVVDPRVQFK
jgi:microcin C transport system permease protein